MMVLENTEVITLAELAAVGVEMIEVSTLAELAIVCIQSYCNQEGRY